MAANDPFEEARKRLLAQSGGTTTTTTVPRTGTLSPYQRWRQTYGTSTTPSPTTLPSTVGPTGTIPRPSRPQSIKPAAIAEKEAEYLDLILTARNAGVAVPASLLPEGAALEAPEADLPWYKDALNVAGDVAGKVLGGALYGISAPFRVVGSTATEVAQLAQQYSPFMPEEAQWTEKPEASFADWFSQMGDSSFSFADMIGKGTPSETRLTPKAVELAEKGGFAQPIPEAPKGHLTGNKWVDIVIEFSGDVAFDPLNYITLGGAAAAKTISKAGSELAAKEVAQALAKDGADALVAKGVRRADIDTLVTNEKLWNDSFALLDETRKVNPDADLIAKYQTQMDNAEFAIKNASDNIAAALNTKGGRIVQAERARVAAAQDWVDIVRTAGENSPEAQRAAQRLRDAVNSFGRGSEEARNASIALDDVVWRAGVNTPEAKQAAKVLDLATEDLVRQGGRRVARRSYRMNAREELAESLRTTREFARVRLQNPNVVGAERAFYEFTVNSITDDVIKNAATRGWNAVSGDVARAIGSAGRSRLAIGRKAWFIPGSEKLTRGFGTGVVNTRLRALNTPLGQRVIDLITPAGRAGMFGESDVTAWRSALRSGKVTPQNAVIYTALLNAQKESIRLINAKRRQVGDALQIALRNVSEEDAQKIVTMLEDPTKVSTLYFRPDEIAKFDRVRKVLDDYHMEVDSFIRQYGGQGVAKTPNYFPHSQTADALRWIDRNPDLADSLGAGFGVDRQFLADNFIERELRAGRKWFGHTLTDADIAGGVKRLNQIAREQGGLDFDFFETDLRKALAGYAATHARHMATLEAAIKLSGLPRLNYAAETSLEQGIRATLPEAIQPTNIRYLAMGSADVVDALNLVTRSIEDLIASPDIAQYIPKNVYDDLLNVLDNMAAYYDQFYMAFETKQGYWRFATLEPADAINTMMEVSSLADEMLQQAVMLRNLLAAGDTNALTFWSSNIFPLAGASYDLERLVTLAKLRGAEASVSAIEDIQWAKLVRQFEEGWTALRVGSAELPDIQVRSELDNILSNIRKTTNPTAAKTAEALIGDFNSFFKAYATATPGFHIRNGISNFFQLLAAGVMPSEAQRAFRIYAKFFRANRLRVVRGQIPLTPEEFVRNLKGVTTLEKKRIIEALSTTDTSSGLFAEAFGTGTERAYRLQSADGGFSAAVDRRLGESAVGLSGRQVPEGARFETIRKLAGSPLTASRALGSTIENMNRFILTYDGLAKGLKPTEALARTNKYLFDYRDLSRADRVARQIIPFWYWMSRNFPLQVELLLTEPKAYARYAALRRTAESEQQPEYLPQYMERAGAFQIREDLPLIGGKIAQPDLGFPGAGQSSPPFALLQALGAIASGQQGGAAEPVRQALGGLSPLLRLPIEYGTGTNLFRGRPIASSTSPLSAEEQQNLYALQNLLPALTAGSRFAQSFGADFSNLDPRLQILLGYQKPYTEGMTEEEIIRMDEQERERRLLQYFGLPIKDLTEQQQLAEIARRRRALEDLIRRAEYRQ